MVQPVGSSQQWKFHLKFLSIEALILQNSVSMWKEKMIVMAEAITEVVVVLCVFPISIHFLGYSLNREPVVDNCKENKTQQ